MPGSSSGGGGGGGGRRRNLVPEARNGLNALKMEAAQSLGVQVPADGYYGFVTARETGALGGFMVKNMIASVEQQLSTGAGGVAGGMAGGSAGGQMGGSQMSGSQMGGSR
jgi:hypothetical protein